MHNYEFMKKLTELDPELAMEAFHEIAKRENEILLQRSRANLQETIDRYSYDMTGQDGEAEIDAAAAEYCDMQVSKLRYEDPERYAEMRAGA